MDGYSMSGASGSPPGGIKAPARKSFADPEVADRILDAPWVKGDNSWIGHVGSKDIIAWAIENKKMIEGGRGESVNPLLFCLGINRKIEGKDPIEWALAKGQRLDGEEPMVWVIKNNKQIDGQHPAIWAAKNKFLIEGQDPIVWADKQQIKIKEQNIVTKQNREIDIITWAAENNLLISGQNAKAWAIDNDRNIDGEDSLNWFKEHSRLVGKDQLTYMIEIGVSKVEKMQNLINEAIRKPNSEQLHKIGLAIIEAKPDVEKVFPALAHLYIKKKGFLPKPKNLIRLNNFLTEIDKNIARAND